MPTGSKNRPLETKYLNLNDNRTLQINKNDNLLDSENELTTVFRDMQISALSKAIIISPSIKSVTLGTNTSPINDSDTVLEVSKNECTVPELTLPFCSTPKKESPPAPLNCLQITKLKKKNENVKEKLGESNLLQDSSFSRQKLLQEYDLQRRLDVDKAVRQRIQNMYDSDKLIRDSLEHLRQTRQEELITRRMLLESKIISDIQEQEILNRAKKEAEWAKDNLKEAQRIQERNKKVKEAEEEARKKSEAILLQRKQIDYIFELQKEYNQEYKSMLETIKSCKNSASVLKLTASHSKAMKDCAAICENILKKCKQGDVTEEEVKSSKSVIETVKSIHEYFKTEINKINEITETDISQKKEEQEKEKNESKPAEAVESTTTENKPLSTSGTAQIKL